MMEPGWTRRFFDLFASKKTPFCESAAINIVAIKVYCERSARVSKTPLTCGELRHA
jgi:hypothetical protein